MNPLDRFLIARVQRALDDRVKVSRPVAALLRRRPAAAAEAARLRHADAVLRGDAFTAAAPIPLRSGGPAARRALAAAALLMLAVGGVWWITPSADDAVVDAPVAVEPPPAPEPPLAPELPDAAEPLLTAGAALEAPLRNEWDLLVRDAAAIWDDLTAPAPDA